MKYGALSIELCKFVVEYGLNEQANKIISIRIMSRHVSLLLFIFTVSGNILGGARITRRLHKKFITRYLYVFTQAILLQSFSTNKTPAFQNVR